MGVNAGNILFTEVETMKVTLPNNKFGVTMMLLLIMCVVLVPLSVVLWLVSRIAPWWVAAPCAITASLIAFLCTVKFKG